VTFNHAGSQVASSARSDLLHRKTKALQAQGIVLGLNVSGEHSNTPMGRERS